MATARQQQDAAYKRVDHLPAGEIKCRFCGESTASAVVLRGYVHKWGPTTHRFMAAKPINVRPMRTDESAEGNGTFLGLILQDSHRL